MQLALKQLAKGKTVIVIAHRLSTIRDADQILVLDEGRISEQGNHDELTAASGLYARMWRAYTDAEQWEIGKKGELDLEHKHTAQHHGG
ncbi:Iron import ATP-binding/permease protein IrtA [compost metagenome]